MERCNYPECLNEGMEFNTKDFESHLCDEHISTALKIYNTNDFHIIHRLKMKLKNETIRRKQIAVGKRKDTLRFNKSILQSKNHGH